jgi:hypothetical protein
MKNDIYKDKKIYHRAGKINEKGQVSALCYAIPRPIIAKSHLWTLDNNAVTCKKCLIEISNAN